MELYRIADEVVEFSTRSNENNHRFKDFMITTKNPDVIIQIKDCSLNTFQNQHKNLGLAQCELLLSMRSFYEHLISKGKLLMHAVAVVNKGFAYIIVAPASGGKSTLANQMVKNQSESAFIFADDRIVLGNIDEAPVVWTTPWSKIINGNTSRYYIVKGFCIVQKREKCSISRVCEEDIIDVVLNEYPKECRMDIEKIIHTINIKKCILLRVQSNIYDLSIEKLYEMMN